jgi:hypothetical protein
MVSENGIAICACTFVFNTLRVWAYFNTDISFEVRANHAVLLDEMQINEANCKVMYFLNC